MSYFDYLYYFWLFLSGPAVVTLLVFAGTALSFSLLFLDEVPVAVRFFFGLVAVFGVVFVVWAISQIDPFTYWEYTNG